MVRNCQLSDLIYLTASRVCVCVCTSTSMHVAMAGPLFFFPHLSLSSALWKMLLTVWKHLGCLKWGWGQWFRGVGVWMENLGGFRMDISMRCVWPRLSTTDTVVCAHTSVFNCLGNVLGLGLVAVVVAAAAAAAALPQPLLFAGSLNEQKQITAMAKPVRAT